MSNEGFETKELDNFSKNVLQKIQKKFPRETLKMMRKTGSKGRTYVAKKSRKEVKKKTGKYHKSWKRGKAYKGEDNSFNVGVYNNSPHGHLIEYGHIQKTKDGREVGFVEGKHILENGIKEFEDEFFDMVEDFIDDMLDK